MRSAKLWILTKMNWIDNELNNELTWNCTNEENNDFWFTHGWGPTLSLATSKQINHVITCSALHTSSGLGWAGLGWGHSCVFHVDMWVALLQTEVSAGKFITFSKSIFSSDIFLATLVWFSEAVTCTDYHQAGQNRQENNDIRTVIIFIQWFLSHMKYGYFYSLISQYFQAL